MTADVLGREDVRRRLGVVAARRIAAASPRALAKVTLGTAGIAGVGYLLFSALGIHLQMSPLLLAWIGVQHSLWTLLYARRARQPLTDSDVDKAIAQASTCPHCGKKILRGEGGCSTCESPAYYRGVTGAVVGVMGAIAFIGLMFAVMGLVSTLGRR